MDRIECAFDRAAVLFDVIRYSQQRGNKKKGAKKKAKAPNLPRGVAARGSFSFF